MVYILLFRVYEQIDTFYSDFSRVFDSVNVHNRFVYQFSMPRSIKSFLDVNQQKSSMLLFIKIFRNMW